MWGSTIGSGPRGRGPTGDDVRDNRPRHGIPVSSMTPTLLQYGLVGLAGMAAGLVNAIAGGGTLMSFPALTAIGMPAVAANVTNTVALWPGWSAACWPAARLRRAAAPAAGSPCRSARWAGIAGGVLLLHTRRARLPDAGAVPDPRSRPACWRPRIGCAPGWSAMPAPRTTGIAAAARAAGRPRGGLRRLLRRRARRHPARRCSAWCSTTR